MAIQQEDLGFQISNPNLLINGDFQIWQRGNTFLDMLSIYTADRWSIGGSVPNVHRTADYTVSITTTTTSNYFGQLLERVSKTSAYTLSAKIKAPVGANFKMGFFNKTKATILYQTNCIGTGEFAVYTSTFNLDKTLTDNILVLPLWQASIGTYEIEWAKLEVGEVATPLVPRLIAEEELLCKRYGEVIPAPVYARNDTGYVISGSYKANKRITPTLKFKSLNGTEGKLSYYNGAWVDASILNTDWTNSTGYSFTLSSTGLSSISMINGSIFADSEIY